ncbi:MAG: protein TolR [Gallionellaceae bacterium]|nr:protein TolR [Gallionellaceae bacterium]MDD5364131.1 protein TolR [Gallionellaceae bacterium]
MNQINVVPYIDVMLVLLVIFMVTAPFINPSQVELPSVARSSIAPVAPLEVMIKADGSLLIRDRAETGEGEAISEAALNGTVRKLQKDHPDRPVVISADKSVRYESVMRVMDTLQRLGVARVGLLVKPAQP